MRLMTTIIVFLAPSALAATPPIFDGLTVNGPAIMSTLNTTAHLTGRASQANVSVTTTAVGSGVNGPATSQVGMRINLSKDNWFSDPTDAAKGEIDPLYITGRQGGSGSDMSGVLIDVQNTGLGFLSGTEMAISIVDPVTNKLTYNVDIQDGALNKPAGTYYGRVYSASIGAMTSALLFQNTEDAEWTNIIQNKKNNAINFSIADTGAISAASLYTSGAGLNDDSENGDLELGALNNSSATPYINWNGLGAYQNCKMINSLMNRVDLYCGGAQLLGLTVTASGVAAKGALQLSTRTITAARDDTLAETDHTVKWNKTIAGASTENIPACNTGNIGRELFVKDGKGDAALNNITIKPSSGTIDAGLSYVISTPRGAVHLQCDGGSDWTVLGKI